MVGEHALLDRVENRLVGLDVDADVLELADLVAVSVDQILAMPLGEVLALGHS
ncbi:MAG TPA: hypothetical protein VFY57_07715 [Rubrobacteraceae bacterium]|nr:hypothetical protein [Rubrobacteraceae bacterium]